MISQFIVSDQNAGFNRDPATIRALLHKVSDRHGNGVNCKYELLDNMITTCSLSLTICQSLYFTMVMLLSLCNNH